MTVKPADLTDEMIAEALAKLPSGHWTTQWYIDAMGPESADHPHRRENARREVASAINARKGV